jgi:PAS domain S-box-containing protein
MEKIDDRPGAAAELRRRAEEKVKADRAKAAKELPPQETGLTLHELLVHQIELEMQNEELRRAQAELEAARERYFDLYDMAPEGYVTVSEQGLILEANLAAATLLGQARGTLVNRPLTRFIFKEDHAIYYLKRKLLLETGKPQAYELRMMKKDGTAFWAHLSTTAARDDAGAPVFRVVMSDITERKLADGELIKLTDMKSKFTSMVAHELRSPLGVINEGVNLVLEGLAGSINDEQKELLSMVKKNTDRLGRLINNVLDFQKMESGKMEFDYCENDINKVASEVCKSMVLLAKEKGLELSVAEADAGIPRIRFDKDRIVQVLTNLVSNAIKFTEKGNITISARQEDGAVHVVVQDTGIGIKAQDMKRLFQVFEQLDSTRDKKKGGTGLGLAISSDIILAHKGKIWAESKAGEGSAIHFTIPGDLKNKKKLGEILIEEKIITEKDLIEALAKQEN